MSSTHHPEQEQEPHSSNMVYPSPPRYTLAKWWETDRIVDVVMRWCEPKTAFFSRGVHSLWKRVIDDADDIRQQNEYGSEAEDEEGDGRLRSYRHFWSEKEKRNVEEGRTTSSCSLELPYKRKEVEEEWYTHQKRKKNEDEGKKEAMKKAKCPTPFWKNIYYAFRGELLISGGMLEDLSPEYTTMKAFHVHSLRPDLSYLEHVMVVDLHQQILQWYTHVPKTATFAEILKPSLLQEMVTLGSRGISGTLSSSSTTSNLMLPTGSIVASVLQGGNQLIFVHGINVSVHQRICDTHWPCRNVLHQKQSITKDSSVVPSIEQLIRRGWRGDMLIQLAVVFPPESTNREEGRDQQLLERRHPVEFGVPEVPVNVEAEEIEGEKKDCLDNLSEEDDD